MEDHGGEINVASIQGVGTTFTVCLSVGKLQNKRLCLKCGKKFLSEGPHNRICVKCGLINDRIIIVGTYSVSLRFSDVMN